MSTEGVGDTKQHAEFQINGAARKEYEQPLFDAVMARCTKLLADPQSRTIDLSKDIQYGRKGFNHVNPKNTLLNLIDPKTNTAFIVDRIPDLHNSKTSHINIRWLSLGEDKGDLPGGWISINHNGGEKPYLTAGKGDYFPKGIDDYWKGTGGINCYQVSGHEWGMAPEEIQQILARLDAAQADVKQTELTANEQEYHMAESGYALAVHQYANFLEEGNWIEKIIALMEFREEERKWETFKNGFKRIVGLPAETPHGLKQLREELKLYKKPPSGRLGPPRV